MKKEKTYVFPEELRKELPPKYNEEWLKTASIKEKIRFFYDFMEGFGNEEEETSKDE